MAQSDNTLVYDLIESAEAIIGNSEKRIEFFTMMIGDLENVGYYNLDEVVGEASDDFDAAYCSMYPDEEEDDWNDEDAQEEELDDDMDPEPESN